MNPNEIIRIVDSLHREKKIDTEIVFQAIEAAFATAARRQYGEESDVIVNIERENGEISATIDGDPLDTEEMIGRIGAQTAKQVIIQKIREAERDSLLAEMREQINETVNGVIQRNDGPTITVSLGNNNEAILPRSEQIPGETYHPNERVRAIICDVRPQGTRVKIVLSRARPRFVQRLFEQEIPEINEGIITVKALAREPGYRSKVAVSSSDVRVDCVGACVGVRGNRIKNIVDELSGERIDIVRWDEDPEIMVPNALQPAEVEQVLLCDMIGRAIVLVREDQLSLAIGRRGQNVRLASKLCGWDIEIMTAEELDEQIDRAVAGYLALDGIDEELAQALVEQGYLSYDDLSVIEPDALMEMGGLDEKQVDVIVEQAEKLAEEAEVQASEARRIRREEDRMAEAKAKAEAAEKLAAGDAETDGEEAAGEAATEATGDAAADDTAGEAATEESGDAAADDTAAEEATEESDDAAADDTAAEEVTEATGDAAADDTAGEAATEESDDAAGDATAAEEATEATDDAAGDDTAAEEVTEESDDAAADDTAGEAATEATDDAAGDDTAAEEATEATDDAAGDDEQAAAESTQEDTEEESKETE